MASNKEYSRDVPTMMVVTFANPCPAKKFEENIMFGIEFGKTASFYFKCLEILWRGALENTTKHISKN